MNDPYEDQLGAARYKAERDQARQRLEGLMKSVDNLDDENERLRDMLNGIAWKLGIGHVVHYYSEDNYQECHKRVLDEISKLTSPTSYDVAQVTTSAYDLLPEADRESLRWVREHGGLYAVETRWDNDTQLADAVIHALWPYGMPDGGGNEDVMDELSKRLMPEGMGWLVEAWPRFEDGELVRFSDDFKQYEYEGSVSIVTMYPDGGFALNLRDYPKGERVRRPAPKALDADGAEIRVGDTVWNTKTGAEYRVLSLPDIDKVAWVTTKTNQADSLFIDLAVLTHRAPVLAADGKPLREGETVWDVDDAHGYTHTVVSVELDKLGHVKTTSEQPRPARNSIHPSRLTHRPPVFDADGVPVREGDTVYSTEIGVDFTAIDVNPESGDVHVRWGYDFEDKTGTIAANLLTHERPDSWERLGEDVDALAEAEINGEGSYNAANDYCTRHVLKDGTVWVLVAQDLVRRARALAEKERDR